ncbi:hypothetical protein GCM10008904_20320 [Paraclostridium ghonii]|uniref:Uncharacterized protein n=1 Tax=Paraclostridium ghonii TaxID=29358 RepID=A0ABU0MWK3_9FIRM|nr:hypothetical protein [Paeniclostridium ghonii]MDQ0555286.1 hypothetical protein [Paeniclostridium ghonii]
MKYVYTEELNNILNKIYKEMILKIAINNKNIDFSKEDLNKTKKILSSEKVYMGSDMDKFIINCVPIGHEGNLFRVSISKYHNRLHPRFENYKGEPIDDCGYNKFSFLLWEEHMNNLLISDLQGMFSQEDFIDFVNNKLDDCLDELSTKVNKYKNDLIKIEFKNKESLLNTISDMIVDKKLDFEFAHILVDMHKLRDDMYKMSTTFDVYNEFDKLEDDTKYCIINYPKYNSNELVDILIKNHGFKLLNEHCLVKNR